MKLPRIISSVPGMYSWMGRFSTLKIESPEGEGSAQMKSNSSPSPAMRRAILEVSGEAVSATGATFNRRLSESASRWVCDGSKRWITTAAAPVSSARVQVSYDDGATWTDAPVQAIGGERFAATYRQPEASTTTGYVSLRVEATDGDGNSVDQTLIRAYRLR